MGETSTVQKLQLVFGTNQPVKEPTKMKKAKEVKHCEVCSQDIPRDRFGKHQFFLVAIRMPLCKGMPAPRRRYYEELSQRRLKRARVVARSLGFDTDEKFEPFLRGLGFGFDSLFFKKDKKKGSVRPTWKAKVYDLRSFDEVKLLESKTFMKEEDATKWIKANMKSRRTPKSLFDQSARKVSGNRTIWKCGPIKWKLSRVSRVS
jgi:hypothetical protein